MLFLLLLLFLLLGGGGGGGAAAGAAGGVGVPEGSPIGARGAAVLRRAVTEPSPVRGVGGHDLKIGGGKRGDLVKNWECGGRREGFGG